MDLISLLLYFAGAAIVLTLIGKFIFKQQNIFIQFIRNFVGVWFIFSGVVKAIDPAGTQIKMEEYFEIFEKSFSFLGFLWKFGAEHALAVSVFMIILEIYLGIALILGTWKKLTLWLLVLLILFFTFLTGYSAKTNKVTDCGCFGDFIKLAPIQSFYKDILLTVLSFILLFGQKYIKDILGVIPNRIILGVLTLASIWFTYRNIVHEPIVDFRPYKVGTSVPDCLKLPPNAKKTIVDMVYTYKNKKTGEVKEFKNSYPDPADYANWQYLDRKDVIVQKGDEPKCKDFIIKDANSGDNTAMFFEEPEYLFFILSPNLDKANEKAFSKMIPVTEDAMKDGKYAFVITGSIPSEAEAFKAKMKIPYDFYFMDPTPIKTIMRSNPGLLILKQGKIIAKFHYNDVPGYAEIKKQYLK